MKRNSKFALILAFFVFMPIVLDAQYIYVPEMPTQYKSKIIPLEGFNNTYIILRVNRIEKDGFMKLFRVSLQFFNRGIFNIFSFDPYYTNVSMIPYDSIKKSKDYSKRYNMNFQHQIHVNCRSYFPVPSGEKRYLLSIAEEDIDLYGLSEVPDILENKSLLVEIDIEKNEHTTSIIDTPSDIFADMCK